MRRALSCCSGSGAFGNTNGFGGATFCCTRPGKLKRFVCEVSVSSVVLFVGTFITKGGFSPCATNSNGLESRRWTTGSCNRGHRRCRQKMWLDFHAFRPAAHASIYSLLSAQDSNPIIFLKKRIPRKYVINNHVQLSKLPRGLASRTMEASAKHDLAFLPSPCSTGGVFPVQQLLCSSAGEQCPPTLGPHLELGPTLDPSEWHAICSSVPVQPAVDASYVPALPRTFSCNQLVR